MCHGFCKSSTRRALVGLVTPYRPIVALRHFNPSVSVSTPFLGNEIVYHRVRPNPDKRGDPKNFESSKRENFFFCP